MRELSFKNYLTAQDYKHSIFRARLKTQTLCKQSPQSKSGCCIDRVSLKLYSCALDLIEKQMKPEDSL